VTLENDFATSVTVGSTLDSQRQGLLHAGQWNGPAMYELHYQKGVHPATLRKFTLDCCTPYRCSGEIGGRPSRIAVGWRIARHSDLPDRRPACGVQCGGRTQNMACIWVCAP
jgi:hypothetical protein